MVLIPAVLTAFTTLVTLWLTKQTRPSLVEKMRPYTEALEAASAQEKVHILATRASIVKQHYEAHVATSGVPRLLLNVIVGVSIPVFAGSAVYFWQVLATPAATLNQFNSTGLLILWALGGLLALCVAYVVSLAIASKVRLPQNQNDPLWKVWKRGRP